MINIDKFSDEYFKIVHISNYEDLSNFSVKKGRGLELYLKNHALYEEKVGLARTYLILCTNSNMIAAYFTLKTGLITVSKGFLKGFDAYSGIELANFAVNDNYREVNDVIPKLGTYVFSQFILKLVEEISNYIGAAYLYIYALPDNKLLNHYTKMGFNHTSEKMRRFVYRHVKPKYDRGCIFMWQKI